jgi:hypothetical protein
MGDGDASLGLGLEIGDLEEDRRADDRISEDKSLREDILIELQRTREREREREARVCGLWLFDYMYSSSG